jgi:hypothetical protein
VFAWLGLASSIHAQQTKESLKYYYVDACIVSLDAKQSLASYQDHGRVSGAPGSTIGNSTPTTTIGIELNVESGRFLADVTMTNKQKPEKPTKKRVDLTNLRPTSIEIETGKDGRTYQLNLVPTIKSAQLTPKSFRTATNELYRLQFHSSQVTLNDRQYVGNMLASDADYFNVEICGLASIEFSLKHLKNAKPWGTLSDGQITIANPDGNSIVISNVTNGPGERLVSGGPYTVWVRWNKPQATVEEYRTALKAQREMLAKQILPGASDETKASILARIDKELAREPSPWIIGCGAHDVQKKELSPDE